MKDPIKDTMRKTFSYWYVDGLTELATGFLLLVVGLFFAVMEMIDPHSISSQLSSIGLPLIILIGGLAGRWAVSSLKERLTYPRTGYVACITTRAGKKLWTLAVGIAASVVFVFISVQFKLDWLKYEAPAFMAATMIAYLGAAYGLRRFYALSVYTLLLGLPMVMLHLQDNLNLALFLFGCGAGFAVSGAFTLKGYLQSTRPPEGEVE